MSTGRYLTAEEAARELGVSRATLYAYVSRGWVGSEAAGGDRRVRRYDGEDVRRLKERKALRRNPGEAQRALHWGAPLIESQITLIADGGLYYRGQEVALLARSHSVEQVASLIWTGEVNEGGLFADRESLNARFDLDLGRLRGAFPSFAALPPVTRFQTLLPLMAAEDLAAYDLRPEMVAQTGARILQTMAALAGDKLPKILRFAQNDKKSRVGIAQTLQEGWGARFGEGADRGQVRELLNAALVLCADHELNVSSFTARCVASASSTPYQVVQAGLAALQGVKHGGRTRRVEAFLREVDTPAGARPAIANRLARGEAIPGFSHPLYPTRDPRASALLEMLSEQYPNAPILALGDNIIAEMVNLIGKPPNVDFALVMLTQLLNLPPGTALTLFALGRTIGWIGHAIEQYQTNRLIRPRARYTGKQPLSS
ncbi:MAG: citrate synthase family protein [Ardenticatenaceae bacterium]